MTAAELARILAALDREAPIVIGCESVEGQAHGLQAVQIATTAVGRPVLLLVPGPHAAPEQVSKPARRTKA